MLNDIVQTPTPTFTFHNARTKFVRVIWRTNDGYVPPPRSLKTFVV